MTDRSAGEITVQQTYDLLEDRHSGLLGGVADGQYVFWLGSGISRARLAGLDSVVKRVLHRLQAEANAEGGSGEWSRAFADAINLARLPRVTREGIDLATPVEGWECFGDVVERLSSQYSMLLDIPVPEPEADFLLWNVVDVATTYGSTHIEPDVEHYCLAVLILEGVAPDLVSANWDGLIEKALFRLVGASRAIAVKVRSEDFRAPDALSRLLKFHGCAVLALEHPETYRAFLVSRRSQITRWPEDNQHDLMRREMSSLAARKRTLMIGLSGQDSNIQDLFSRARAMLEWRWDTLPPALAFAEDALGFDQRAILQVAYGDDYRAHRDETESAALIRAYAKPLLAALVIGILERKLETLASVATVSSTNTLFLSNVRAGLTALSGLVAAALSPISADRIREYLFEWGRLLSVFRLGSLPGTTAPFAPLGNQPLSQMVDDPAIVANGAPEFAIALAVIGAECLTGEISIDFGRSDGARAPFIQIAAGERTSKLFFTASESAAIRLELTGAVDVDDPDQVIVHSESLPLRQQRSPTAPRGRTGNRGTRRIEMAELLADGGDLDRIRREFREGLAI